MTKSLSVLACLFLVACPDPQSNVNATPSGAPAAGGMGGQAAGGPGGAAGGGAGAGAGMSMGNAKPWSEETGEKITLSGTLKYPGSKTGTYRIDFLGHGQNAGLFHTETLEAAGEWSVQAPKSAGEIFVVAFLDVDKDGPSPTDPAGRIPDKLTVGETEQTGLVIELSDTPDLGELTPGRGGGGQGAGGGMGAGGMGAGMGAGPGMGAGAGGAGAGMGAPGMGAAGGGMGGPGAGMGAGMGVPPTGAPPTGAPPTGAPPAGAPPAPTGGGTQ